jgi:flagellar basal-body rod protein FlgB
MDAGRIDPIALADQRLRWLDRRQAVLAENVANADTPGFQPRDVAPFASALAGAEANLVRTNAQHLAALGSGADGRALRDRSALERTPNGNGVSLDQQALKIADNDQAHALAVALHHRWIGMLRTALGRGGG